MLDNINTSPITNEPSKNSTITAIQPPYWSVTFPRYYRMLCHEFSFDQIRFQEDVINPINATFEFINQLEIKTKQKYDLKELCIANAAFSARAANDVYFARQRKEKENWSHAKWRQRELDWQYATFHTALILNLFYQKRNITCIDLKNFSIRTNDDEIAFSITNTIKDIDHEMSPRQFYPLIKRMQEKTSDFLKRKTI